MKRSLTGIAAAAVVLGAMSPMAFAATSKATGLTKAGQLPIVVNGQVLSNPYEMTGKDSGNTTAFFPVYYFNQALSKIGNGYSATWDGTTHTWAITAPGVDASKISISGGVGTGNTTITVNGTVVKKINTQAAKDPAASKSAGKTTYFPAYYIDEIFNQLGAKVSFNGQTGLSITTATNTAGAGLSAISATGASNGDGSASNPAVSLNGKAITLSTTLTDANGNPLSNTAVTFNVSEYGNTPSYLPTVENASGTVISGTAATDKEQYVAYTDANGTASISIQGPSGKTYAYEVIATAPYQGAAGGSISSAPAYVEFVANNEAGIAPLATSDNAFGATLGVATPITVAVPPNSDGTAQANVLVTLKTTGNAYFTNASGADLGQSIQVATNSAGLAQTYLNDATAEQVSVSATLPPSLGVTNPDPTYINFAQGGVATKIANYSISSKNVDAGQNVTVSGQLQDAAGNVVANGQILVSGNDTDSNGDFGTVNSDGSITSFPIVQNPLPSGTNASGFGTVVTADANGNFSFQLTDPDDNETGTFYIYSVSNGEIQNLLKTDSIDFTYGTQLSSIAVSGTRAGLGDNDTSISSVTSSAYGTATVYVEPQNAAGDPINGQSFTYNLTTDNNAKIDQINGVSLPNPVGSLTVTVTANSDGTYSISVPGENNVTIPPLAQSGDGTDDGTSAADFSVGVTNENTGTTNLTITSGGKTAKAAITFNGGAPYKAGSATVQNATVTPGGIQDIGFTVEDQNGNPVAQTAVKVKLTGGNGNFWLTKVNGEALTTNEYVNGANTPEPTPIPLETQPTSDGYWNDGGVNISGVVSWNGGNNPLTVYTDDNGQVMFTLAAGGISYYNGATTGAVTTGVDAATAPDQIDLGYDRSSGYEIDLGASANDVAGETVKGSVSVSGATTGAQEGTITLQDVSGSIVAGQNITVNGTVTDAYGDDYTGTATISGAGISPKNVQVQDGSFSTPIAPTLAGNDTLTLSVGGNTVATTTVNVTADTSDETAVVSAVSPDVLFGTGTGTLTNVTASETYQLTLSAQDEYGNPIANAQGWEISFAADAGAGTAGTLTLNGVPVSGDTPITFTNGKAVVSYTASDSGTDTITVTDSNGTTHDITLAVNSSN
ncbi:hypothetical protein AAC03nite_05050 [Alicyclobacillus acidoterrestris]|nr:hypothetical protein AAC03nite_05050 [Alicyclobacillus acidoterrestris]